RRHDAWGADRRPAIARRRSVSDPAAGDCDAAGRGRTGAAQGSRHLELTRTMESRGNMDGQNRYASPEDLRYASVLQIGAWVGLVMLIASFAVYVSGAVSPLIPLNDLPKYWGLSAREFVAATHQPIGWAWVEELGRAD